MPARAGNAGTREVGENVPLKATDFPALKQFAIGHDVQMVVVGPEDPLVQGIYDAFQADEATRHIAVIGPSQSGARLEGSKDFAKDFMLRHGIPTARHLSVTAANLAEGLAFLETLGLPRNPLRAIRAEGRRPLCRQGRAHPAHLGRGEARASGDAGRHVRPGQCHGVD